jgi:hypothetical protein
MGQKFLLPVLAIFFGMIVASTAMCQGSSDYRRWEFFVGYSHNRVDVGPDLDNNFNFNHIFNEREGFNGVEASIVGNFHRYFGAKFDYSYHQRRFGFGGDRTTVRIQNVLGGIQIKDNANEGRFKPFAHALAGFGRTSADLSQFDNSLEDFHDTGFAAALGGGVDIRLARRFDVRAIQLDWNPMRFDFSDFGVTGIPGTPVFTGTRKRTLNNIRIGVGLVFH